MNYFVAFLPILLILVLMLVFRMGVHIASPLAFLAGLVIAVAVFGLTWDGWWISQAKGLLLSINVLVVLWAALFLYFMIDQVGGIRAISESLSHNIQDRGLLLLVLAWVFTAVIEGLAGYGLPIAIVAPMLIALGIGPIQAIAAAAVGHSWAVSLGNMGIVFQTLTMVTGIEGRLLGPPVALLMGIICLGCGLGTALILKQIHRWKMVLLLAAIMSAVQFLLTTTGLSALGSFFTGLTGILLAVFISRPRSLGQKSGSSPALHDALIAYGLVVVLVISTTLITPLNHLLNRVVWKWDFPEVATTLGVVTPAGSGQTFRPFLHPGTLILVSILISLVLFQRRGYPVKEIFSNTLLATLRSIIPATIGVVAMVGLSTLMEHSGMTMLLASGLSLSLGQAFPIVSPLVGMLGAFATGSNNNSNVLFAPMQKGVAVLLGLNPAALAASQTAGGSIGSMIAPAKIGIGASTSGQTGREAEILRITLPVSLVIGLITGLVTWLVLS
ncbi:MAG: L-lactate permease [Anaerolineaceae bacterium]